MMSGRYHGQRSATQTGPANRGAMVPAKLVTWMALAVLACEAGSGAKTEPATGGVPPAAAALSERDLDAYATGTRAQIDLLRHAIQSGHPADGWQIDSTAAAAAGVSVERFREIRAAVEVTLKTQSALAGRAARLDSLRIELLVARVRAEAAQ